MVLSGLAVIGPLNTLSSPTTSVHPSTISTGAPTGAAALPQAQPLPGANPSGQTHLPAHLAGTAFALPLQAPPGHPSAASPVSSASTAASPVAASPRAPTGFGPATTTITGRVLNTSSPYAAISGANVVEDPIGVDCTGQESGCPTGTTNSQGNYTITDVAPGNMELVVTVGWYESNYTTLYNVPSGAYNAGVIYLVPDAVVSGCVYGAADLKPAKNIQISGWTRDLSVEALPTTFSSGSNGCFNTPGVAVPPGPAVIQYAPPAGLYESNDTFVDLQPGQHYALPFKVYLTEGVRVTAEPYDSTTGNPINGGLGGAGYVATTLKGTLNQISFSQGLSVSEGNQCTSTNDRGCPVAFGPPGNDTITVDADGYVENSSTVYIPKLSPGSTYNAGKVWLVPDGAIEETSGFTWPTAVKAAASYSPTVNDCDPFTGCYTIAVCSLSGYLPASEIVNPFGGINMSSSPCKTSCGVVLKAAAVLAAPLRDSIEIAPDTTEKCNGYEPSWPIPDDLPVFDNFSWANVTPDEETNLGHIDFTAGNYITGTVQPEGRWSVQGCSTDEVTFCFNPASAINTSGRYGACDQGEQGEYDECPDDAFGCPNPSTHGGTTFCVPAPPGPDTLIVTSENEGQNITWAYVVPGSFTGPVALSTVDPTHISTINLTIGSVTGSVHNAVTGAVIPNTQSPIISIKPAGSANGGGEGPVINGNFSIGTSPGWEEVTATATNYEPNTVWVFVANSPTPTPVGTINLTPVSWLSGQVFDSNGTPIKFATVQTCPLVDEFGGAASGCEPVLQGGFTTSNGLYGAKLDAGAAAQGMYEVLASAPGYITNFTWVNITQPGGYYNASVINLTQFLTVHLGDAPADRPTALSSGSGGGANPDEYVIGYVVDNVSNDGLPMAQITLNPVIGGSPIDLLGSVTDGGFFNYTVTTGQYWANFSATGYYPTTVFLNISGLAPQIDIGVIRLSPFTGYIDGQLTVSPWASLTDSYAAGGDGLGPGSIEVEVCQQGSLSICNKGEASTSGFFNLSAPWGYHDSVVLVPTGTSGGGEGSAPGGWLNGTSNANVINGSNRTFVRSSLQIFGGLTGLALDQSTKNTTPVRFGTFAAQSVNNRSGPSTVAEIMGGGGEFTVFLAPGWTVSGGAVGTAYLEQNFTSPKNTANISAGVVNEMTSFSLEHYGWITGQATTPVSAAGATNDWVPQAGVATQAWFPTLNSALGSSQTADGTGYFNVTAPPSENVSLTIDAPDFNSTEITNLWVNQSTTVNVTAAQIGPKIIPWGWINGTAWDPTLGIPVPGASVLAQDTTGVIQGKGGVTTATNGFFVTDAPPFPVDQLLVKQPGFISNISNVAVQPGAFTELGHVNLTADGVVAGAVIGEPGNVILGGAIIAVCPLTSPQCTNFTTSANQAGLFWALAPPGIDIVNITFPGYAANVSVLVKVTPDSWQWIGTVQLSEFATVAGTLLGIPSGLPLFGANASFCSTYLLPGEATGPCIETVQTNPGGGFLMSIAAGNYIMEFNDSGYAPTYLPVSLTPGEQVSLGSVLLQADGFIAGTVVGADTDSPVPGTQVIACADWVGGACTATGTANTSGGFFLTAVPGPYLLTSDAPGYEDAFGTVQVESGATTNAGLIQLVPIGSSGTFTLSGTVISTNDSAPLAEAEVSAGGAFSTTTGANGEYTLALPWGTYVVTARAGGYTSQVSAPIKVHADVSGIDFGLTPTEFTLSGSVLDGLTALPVSGLSLENSTGIVATTDSNGQYSVLLANGTYTFTLVSNGVVQYATSSFTVVMNGGPVQRDLQVFPPQTTIDGLVVDSASGLPVANATFEIIGQTSSGIPWSATYSSTELGTVSVPLYQGTYTISATAIGYQNGSKTLSPTGSTQQVVLSLNQVPTTPVVPASTGSSMSDWFQYAAVAAIGAIVLGGIFLLTAGRKPKGRAVSRPPASPAKTTPKSP
ncbi:MAG: carboxypeptidase-like regulatory domain-containing protein [Thermoplasmata archaeon]|nr:carboxypeptidase-like regulatory domain-containing protein [Thermoplasmata archaeon]